MKTTSNVEGYHQGLGMFFSKHHPTIWRFIEMIKEFDADVWKEVRAWDLGNEPPRSKKWDAVYQRKRLAVMKWDNVVAGTMSRRQYLRDVAQTLS